MLTKEKIFFISNYLSSFNLVSQYYEYYDSKYLEIIEKHADVLFANVLRSVLNYCKVNKVKIVEFDDVKIAYFLGKELSILENDFVYMIVMVDILNFLTKHKTSREASKDMLRKIKNHITNGTWTEEYGQHGIYSIFKTIIKSC